MRGTLKRSTMMAATMPMMARGVQPSGMDERASGAAGTEADVDIQCLRVLLLMLIAWYETNFYFYFRICDCVLIESYNGSLLLKMVLTDAKAKHVKYRQQ